MKNIGWLDKHSSLDLSFEHNSPSSPSDKEHQRRSNKSQPFNNSSSGKRQNRTFQNNKTYTPFDYNSSSPPPPPSSPSSSSSSGFYKLPFIF
jgi:hypothetical protein